MFFHKACTHSPNLSLHDALPIFSYLEDTNAIEVFDGFAWVSGIRNQAVTTDKIANGAVTTSKIANFQVTILERSEEHTSELQSRENIVCRDLPEKKTYTHSSRWT